MVMLPGWLYRKLNPIPGLVAGAVTNYQMKITVHREFGTDTTTDIYLNGKCRSDFGDIRWTKEDGLTLSDYWIESTSAQTFGVTTANLNFLSAAVASDGTVYGGSGTDGKIYKSIDNGANWTEKYTIPGSPTEVMGMWIDSVGYIYASATALAVANAGLYRSVDAGENWTKVLALNANCSIWRLAEDTSGNLLAAVYSTGDGSEHEAYIYRSLNNGDSWTQVYYDAALRHCHGVWYDQYQDCFYATLGEATGGVIKSVNGGTDWTSVKSGAGYDFTSFVCTASYRFWGTDINAGNTIKRTSDDDTFTAVYTCPANYDAQFFWGRIDIGGGIYFSGVNRANNHPHIVYSGDSGDNWVMAYDFGLIGAEYSGSRQSSNVSPMSGLIFFGDTAGNGWKMTAPPVKSCVFWVEIPSIPASGTIGCYIYYNKADGTSVSNGANTFSTVNGHAFDDMERGNDGDVIGGIWTVAQGSVKISTDHAYGGTRCMKLFGGATVPVVQMTQTGVSSVYAIRCRLWKETLSSENYFNAHGNESKRVLPAVRVSGAEDIMYYTANAWVDTTKNLTPDAWELLETNNINFAAGTYDIYQNGTTVKSGAGMQADNGQTNVIAYILNDTTVGRDMYIDDFIVRNWRAVEPVWGNWGSQETETQTYEYSSTGGCIVGGNFLPVFVSDMIGAGGALFGGLAQQLRIANISCLGGAIVGGQSGVNLISDVVFDGGAIMGGISFYNRTLSLVGHGGAIVSGLSAFAKTLDTIFSGGMIAAGQCSVNILNHYVMIGGAVVGGHPVVIIAIPSCNFVVVPKPRLPRKVIEGTYIW